MDVLIEGHLTDINGTKEMNLEKNIEYAKTHKSIKLDEETK
jgi:hypothetical protein